MGQTLTERQGTILTAVVRNYILWARPVGSFQLRQTERFPWSAATIRHELAELDRYGHLLQPYPSAGRIPTDRAYRFFVDTTIGPLSFNDRLRPLPISLPKTGQSVDEFIRRVSQFLSSESRFLCLVTIPGLQDIPLREIRFVPFEEGKIMVVMVISTGLVQSYFMPAEETLSTRDLGLINFLCRRYRGLTLEEIRERVSRDLHHRSQSLVRLLHHLREQVADQEEKRKENLLIEGGLNLLEQPEFAQIEKIRALLRIIRQKKIILSLINGCLQEAAPTIFIGSEIPIDEMTECGLISVPYGRGGSRGTITLVGPKRMDYPTAFSLATSIASHLTSSFSPSISDV